MKYTHYVLPCTVVNLLCNVLKKYLIPCTHNYSIYYLRKFLQLLIHGYLASDTTINSSKSTCASNILVTLLSSKSMLSTGLRIIILNHSDGTTFLSISGYTDVLRLSRKDNGHNTNASQIHLNISHS